MTPEERLLNAIFGKEPMSSNGNKVYNGTPNHSVPSLCDTCRNATVIQGLAESDLTVYCNALPSIHAKLKDKVVSCSQYDDKRMPSLYDMRQVAWKVATDKKGDRIGFMSPQEFRKRADSEGLREAGIPGHEDY